MFLRIIHASEGFVDTWVYKCDYCDRPFEMWPRADGDTKKNELHFCSQSCGHHYDLEVNNVVQQEA